MALLLAATLRGLRRGRRDPERALLAALQAGVLAFVVHMTWDWDWDMAAAGTAFFLLVAAASSYITHRETPGSLVGAPSAEAEGDVAVDDAVVGRRAGHRGRRGRGAGTAVTRDRRAGARPRLGTPAPGGAGLGAAVHRRPRPEPRRRARRRRVSSAAAADSARRAASWDPLAAEPLITLALVEQQRGQNRAALESLDSAARLQPENYMVHYQRGLLLDRVFDRREDAAAAFRRALELNPLHESSRSELERLVAGG